MAHHKSKRLLKFNALQGSCHISMPRECSGSIKVSAAKDIPSSKKTLPLALSSGSCEEGKGYSASSVSSSVSSC